VRWRRESRLAAGLVRGTAVLLGVFLPGADGAAPKRLRERQASLSARSHGALLSLYALDSRLSRGTSELAARVREVQTLEAEATQTSTAMTRERAGRVAYLASLARQQRLTKRQIRALDSRARQVVVKAQQVQAQSSPSSGTAPAGPPWVVAGTRTLTVTSTGYSLKGRTATGLPVGLGIVAVDPAVIPLGTRLTIPGYGEGIAADTGGAVQGMTIDLWFPTLTAAMAWGRRTVTVTLH
jgi:3D (Asp-Asp-Asp) domain-containing protein